MTSIATDPRARNLPSAFTALGLFVALASCGGAAADPLSVGEAVLEPVALASLPGFKDDDHPAALAAFRLTCAAPLARLGQPAAVTGALADLAAACEAARAVPAQSGEQARAFFEGAFVAYRVTRPGRTVPMERQLGYLTGYFEPELTGSLTPGPGFTAAVLARPDDLVSFDPGQTPAGLDPALRSARRTAAGFEPYPDRAAIEDGALGARAKPLLWLRDAVDLLVLQTQGSGRVRLPDGRSLHLRYDGKNGRPYSSVAKRIVTEGFLPLEGLTLERWAGWLRAHPDEARRMLRMNAAYVFFRIDEQMEAAPGPPGGAGVPLTPGRSLAVDSTLWRYGLPFWLEGRLSDRAQGLDAVTLHEGRLVVAQDTGTAIVGPARGDLYLGTGEAAGAAAGDLRHGVGFVVLLPKPVGTASLSPAATTRAGDPAAAAASP